MYLMRISQTTRRDVSDPTKATLSPHNNSDATGRVESDVEQSKWLSLSGEAKRYNRWSVELRTTQLVRMVSVLIGPCCIVNDA